MRITVPSTSPLAPAGLSLIAGLLTATCVPPALAGAGAAIALIGALCARRALPIGLPLALGLVLGGLAQPAGPPGPGHGLRRGDVITVTGEVVRAPPPTRYRQVLDLVVETVGEAPDAHRTRFDLRIRSRRDAWPGRVPAPGARVQAYVRIRQTGRRRLYGDLLATERLRVLDAAPLPRRAVTRARRRAAAILDERLRPFDAGLARALVAGDRERLSFVDRLRFRSMGQSHLLAVSGLHVALVAGALLGVLRALGLPLLAAHATALIAVIAYVPFTGAPPSAVRAGIGTVIYLLAPILARPTTGLGVLAVVVIAISMVQPHAYGRIGLWLSLCAVAGILVVGPRLAEAFVPRRPMVRVARTPGRAFIRRGMAVSIAAWLGTLPVIAAFFGEVCWIAAPLSVLALPFVAVLLAAALLMLVTGGVPVLGDAVAPMFAHTADALRLLFDACRAAGLDAQRVGPPSPAWHAAFLVLVTQVVRAPAHHRIRWLAGLLVLIALLPAPAEAGMHGPREYDLPAPRLPPVMAHEECMDAIPLALTAAGLLAFALVAVRPLGWLTRGGAGAAFVLGVGAAWQLGAPGLCALMATFLVTTALSKLSGRVRSGPRTTRQVIANGAAPMLGVVLAALGSPYGGLVFLGGLAFLGADTVSSEIGTRYGGRARRVLSLAPVAAGTSGGVSLLGSVAGALGAFIAPLAWCAVAGWGGAGIVWIALAGVAGGVADSVLGDTVQYRGRTAGGELTERTTVDGEATERVRGWRWLDNDAVNLVGGLVAGGLAVLLAAV